MKIKQSTLLPYLLGLLLVVFFASCSHEKKHVTLFLPSDLLKHINDSGVDKFIFTYHQQFLGPIVLEGGTFTSTNGPVSHINAYKLSKFEHANSSRQLNFGEKKSELMLTKKDIIDDSLDVNKDYLLKPVPYEYDERYVSYEIHEVNEYKTLPVVKGRIDPCPPCK